MVIPRFLVPTVLMVATVVSTFARLRAGRGAMAFYDDDFFYYLKIARNLAAGLGSTFDGIHPTNGYHPLWLLLLALLAKILPVELLFIAVLCLMCLSTLAVYFLSLEILGGATSNTFAVSLYSAFLAFSALRILHGGMEIVLTLPLALALCWFRVKPSFTWNARSALLYGLLASLVVLSRLDSLLLVTPLFAFEILWQRNIAPGERFRRAAWMAAGLLPIVLYALVNRRYFGVFLPISGIAKQLRIHHGFNPEPFRGIILWFSAYLRLLIVFPTILIASAAIACAAIRGWRDLPVRYRPLASALLVFPLLQAVSLSWLSDWPIFSWYLYSFVLAEAGAGLILFAQKFRLRSAAARGLQGAAALVLLLVMIIYTAGRLRSGNHPEENLYWMYNSASHIASFGDAHPGVYAMGDRGGMPGYLLRDPVIQLEGLVMDKQYLDNIRQERDLTEVLRSYGVAYYIATDPDVSGACYEVREPIQAGPDSHAMRGRLCQAPLDHSVSNGVVTDIFDVR